MSEHPVIFWHEAGQEQSARWRSESGAPPPKRVVIADDRMTADAAYRLACEGTALLWRGDFQNARQLLQAMARRADEKPRKTKIPPVTPSVHARSLSPTLSRIAGEGANESLRELQVKEAFHLHRQARSQRARILNMLLLPFNSDHSIPLRRAPDVHLACVEAYGSADDQPYVTSLRELLGLISAHEWRKNGVEIAALSPTLSLEAREQTNSSASSMPYARIRPHYGVYSPIRGEYIDLVANAPLPGKMPPVAFDIGTGTGVLAAVLARRGIGRIIATDQDQRALTCARENIARLGLDAQVEVVEADLFPEGRAALIVCNPPWVPARPSSALEYAIYDPESRMLKGFLNGLAAHLELGGEGWLILSDLAEHLGLRTRDSLLETIDAAGLQVLGRIDVKPHHPKVSDISDALHAARKAEVTSLWRLSTKSAN